ncbi:hypothetical protein NL676_028309 [Syzygium grande]|nr:hypothetical protein NL676_028309 [Syzygium grande]
MKTFSGLKSEHNVTNTVCSPQTAAYANFWWASSAKKALRWSLIAGRLPGRTSNDVKNYWNTHLVKKIIHHKKKEDNQPRKFATKVNIIRPRPSILSKSLAWLGGKATLVALRTPPGENPGQPSPMLSRQDKESARWENLLADNGPEEGLVNSRSGSEGRLDASS